MCLQRTTYRSRFLARLFTMCMCSILIQNLCVFVTPTGAGVGRQRVQGSEGEAHHSPASTVGHSRRRGAGQSDQGDDRRRWRYSTHPQVADRQEGRPGVGVSLCVFVLACFSHIWGGTIIPSSAARCAFIDKHTKHIIYYFTKHTDTRRSSTSTIHIHTSSARNTPLFWTRDGFGQGHRQQDNQHLNY